MICMWFTGINYYKLAVEKERDLYFYEHMETMALSARPGAEIRPGIRDR